MNEPGGGWRPGQEEASKCTQTQSGGDFFGDVKGRLGEWDSVWLSEAGGMEGGHTAKIELFLNDCLPQREKGERITVKI